MRKNLWKAMCLAMVLACTPVPAMAADVTSENVAVEYKEDTITPRADILYYVHQSFNGVKMHRLWNETKGVWVGPWEECDCR